MTDKYITSSQYREGLNSIKEYIDKSIPHIRYSSIFTLSADKVLEIYNSNNHAMEFDKPINIDLNKEIIMTYNNEDILHGDSPSNFLSYKNDNISIIFHIGSDINQKNNENKMVITINSLNTNITSNLILKQGETKYLNNKYLKKDVAIQHSITIGTRLFDNIGQYSFSNGKETTASGDYSHAEGVNTQAVNANCHAEGCYSCASGSTSHAEGYWSSASGNYSHAEGSETTASGNYSHAEGNSTKASGESSHAEGSRTVASGVYSHAEGMDTEALGAGSHAEGWGTTASSLYSHTEGYFTKASSKAQHVQGQCNIEDTKNKYAHIVGNGTDVDNRSNAHTLDWNGNAWFAGQVEGTNLPYDISSKKLTTVPANDIKLDDFITINNISINKDRKHYIEFLGSEKLCMLILQNNSGELSCTIGDYMIMGMINSSNLMLNIHKMSSDDTTVDTFTDLIIYEEEVKCLNNKYLENDLTVQNSISLGRIGNIGTLSSAVGQDVRASGEGSHSEGYSANAAGNFSHAEGSFTEALAEDAHAEGSNTVAASQYQHVQGQYNIKDAEGKYAHIVGNGKYENRSNAHTLDWNGNAWFAGKLTQEGTPTDDKDLITKKYVDDKISNIPDAYTLLYPKEVDRTIAYYDIYDLPLGDYRIAQQDGIRTWNICVYVNNIRTQLFSTQNSRGFSFSKRINGTGTADGKSGRLITIDTYSMTTGGETYTWMVYDDGSVDVKNHKATILSAYTNTEFTPTKDYQPATKKYVDDAKASIVVPTKTSELTNDSNFLTKHQSLTGLATETFVNNKVAGIVNSAPETLDTLKELATSLGNDPNFATTVSNQIGNKVDKVDGMSLTHNDLTDELKANYDAAYNYSQAKHSYNDLTDKPTIPSIEGLATKENPVFTGNISMGRKKGSTIGGYSVAIGYNITASGYASHAEGDNTVASGNQSHAEGERTEASGYNSHAEGYKTIASNTLSHAEGNSTTASGNCSHAEGYYTTASGDYSHAEGYNTISSSENQHVQGKYNIEDNGGNYAHIVGNGDTNNRSNAHTLDWNGNAWYAGKLTQEGTPTNDKDLITKKYFDVNKPTVPTKTSELTNDSNFLTKHQSLVNYATIEYVDSKLTTNYVSKEELTESTKPADTTTVKTTLNDILGGDYIE